MGTFGRIAPTLLLFAVLAQARANPAAPSPSASTFSKIYVFVSDTAIKPLPGATVDLLDQSLTVASAISDAYGGVAFSGKFRKTVMARATREGYVTAEQLGTASNNPRLPGGSVIFHMKSLTSPVTVEREITP